MTTSDLVPRLQTLLTRWDEQAATAARKLERSKNPTGGAYYAGAMYGYEDCADELAMLLKEVFPMRSGSYGTFFKRSLEQSF